MKTKQIGSENKPPDSDDTLALIIKCPKCDAQRAFRVNDSIALVLTRQASGVEYDTWCEVCNHNIAVQLAWTKRWVPGWVAERLSFEKTLTVEDTIGMSKTKGEKTI